MPKHLRCFSRFRESVLKEGVWVLCRLSLAESGQQALGLSEELERVRAVFEEEELARENFHAEREQNKRRIEALERAVATEHKEVDRMKTRIEGVQKENRAPQPTPAAALFISHRERFSFFIVVIPC